MALANVAEVFLATVSFDAGSLGYGLMWAASGLGAVVGALYASIWLERRSMTVVYAIAIGLMGIGDIAAGCSPNVWVALMCVLLGGLGNATAIVCNSVLVQRGAPDSVRGRVFTVIMGATSAVLGIGMALTGPLVDAVGARWTYVIAGTVALVAAATAFLMLRREPARVPEPATS
jgi:MFS family permease